MQFQLLAAFPGHVGRQSPDKTLPKESCDSRSQVHLMEEARQILASAPAADAACAAPRSAESITHSTCHFPPQEVTGDGGIWSVTASQRARCSHHLCLPVFQRQPTDSSWRQCSC